LCSWAWWSLDWPVRCGVFKHIYIILDLANCGFYFFWSMFTCQYCKFKVIYMVANRYLSDRYRVIIWCVKQLNDCHCYYHIVSCASLFNRVHVAWSLFNTVYELFILIYVLYAILVTSDNFLQLFIGWEGVGLCSYLLINFWFTRILANKAALKAMIVNRIADVFFILAFYLFFLFLKRRILLLFLI